jgi:hypothetical protein
MPWLSTGRSRMPRPSIGVSTPTGYSWQVALQHCLLPLRRLVFILQPCSPLAKQISANGNLSPCSLSHLWGSPQSVPEGIYWFAGVVSRSNTRAAQNTKRSAI